MTDHKLADELPPLSSFEDAPKWDLVGPTVDDDIRRAIARYGANAVKEAASRLTRPKRGRKPEPDWPELREIIDADARDWLSGGDPFKARSNYSIAKDFADRSPGHSHPATMKRIERKLAKTRKVLTLLAAQLFGKDDYPYGAYLRTLEAITEVNVHPVWKESLARARSDIADYAARYGDTPPNTLSMAEVEAQVRKGLLAAIPKSGIGGIFGTLGSNGHLDRLGIK